MNVAISTLLNSGIKNGLGKYIKYLIQSLQEVDSSHEFYILVNEEFDKAIDIWHPNFHKCRLDIPHHPRLIMRPRYFFWQNFLVDAFLRKNAIDVFHLPNPVPLFRTPNVKYVVTIHDVAEYATKRYSVSRQQLRKIAMKSLVGRASEFITVSNFSKSEIRRILKINENNLHVTYPGLTLDVMRPLDPNASYARKFFLHVGGTRPNKNVNNLIEAFLKLNRKDVDLVFVGNNSGYQLSYAKKERLESKGIFIKGEVSEGELRTLYEHAIALVYPSIYEGFGLPIVEAMASSLPVITSGIPPMSEIGGKAVCYVDPKNINEIRDAMLLIMNDSRYRLDLIKLGLDRVNEFDWVSTAQKTISVYKKAVLG